MTEIIKLMNELTDAIHRWQAHPCEAYMGDCQEIADKISEKLKFIK